MVMVVAVVVVLAPYQIALVAEFQVVVTAVGDHQIFQLQEQLIQVVAVVVAVIFLQTQLRLMVLQVVQVTHELLIGVNYGTTLCIS
jgi:hypothetical protein